MLLSLAMFNTISSFLERINVLTLKMFIKGDERPTILADL